MSRENTTIARRQGDGTLVEVMPDGTTRPLVDRTDWERLRGMTEDEVEAAALSDPDAQPLTPERIARMKPVSRVKTLRRAFRLTQEAFAARYQSPLGTLRDWKQARAYPRAIAGGPGGVEQALQAATVRA